MCNFITLLDLGEFYHLFGILNILLHSASDIKNYCLCEKITTCLISVLRVCLTFNVCPSRSTRGFKVQQWKECSYNYHLLRYFGHSWFWFYWFWVCVFLIFWIAKEFICHHPFVYLFFHSNLVYKQLDIIYFWEI